METPACNVAEDLKDAAQPRVGLTWEADQESDLTLYPTDPAAAATFFITTGGSLFQVSVTEVSDPHLRALFLEPPGPANV